MSVRVLIVDDQEPFRLAARMVVELTDGFDVVGEAETGEASVAMAEELKPDLVLMDVNLPGINGLDATRQMDAAAAYAIGFDPDANHWRCFVHVENGKAGAPPFQLTATPEETRIVEVLKEFKEPVFYPLEPLDKLLWPGVADWHEREGHKSAYLLPLTFGDGTSKGCIGLVFRQAEVLTAERAELALAIAHQVMLCIGLKKLGMAAKNAAVLAERNRIGQEIHDGLAQGFTGILMQLGAAEEAMRECTRESPLPCSG